ncbi:MAG: V-type ATP synthase subunit I [Bacteroidales bacterium]|jgi:V/A-type H+-transporting ATPase subunit I|nr:V-type ATP synthase subunit I [Bacteroidales bacterium]
MIVPMYKYAFLVHAAQYPEFLKDLRKLGVVHIDKKVDEPSEEMQELMRHINETEQAIKKLDWFTGSPGDQPTGLKDGPGVFKRIREIEKEQEYVQHHRARLEKEESQLEPWGNFDWDNLQRLEAAGLEFRFFTCPAKKFQTQWQVDHYISLVDELKGNYFFVKIDRKGADVTAFSELPGVDQLFPPQNSLTAIREELATLQGKNKALHDELEQIALQDKEKLKEFRNGLRDQWAEMNALRQTGDHVEGKVRVIEGFVPETRKPELDAYLEEKGILSVANPPDPEVKSPILLKNNKFARVYEVIGNLYDLPNHREMDLVPFFAPFYMLFFGFCMGDAGYGLLILLGTTLAKRKMPAMKDILTLAQYLGLSTIIFGILTGTFFGISIFNFDIPALENFKKYLVDTDKLFILAIAMGVIQILFGMVVKVFNIKKQQGLKYALSTIGWLVLIIGSGAVMGLKKVGLIADPLATTLLYVVLGIAGVLILVLNNPKRNPLINIGAGLWDVYGMATGLLGDLLSYIRLFALGVSTAILGGVFNSLALNMKPDIPVLGPLVMIIILLIGHGITLFMACLGAFVHPIRLTFVEFYKNAGFTGGGKPYTPFEQHAAKN